MPEVPVEDFVEAVKALVKVDEEWGPRSEGSSLYIRPFLFGNDEAGAFYAVSALSPVLYSVLCIVSNVFYYLLILFALRSAIIGIWKIS